MAGTNGAKRFKREGMPHRAIWRKSLLASLGRQEAQRFLDRLQSRYMQLVREGPLPGNKALRYHLLRGILPGLALYQELLGQGLDQTVALARVRELLFEAFQRQRRQMEFMGRFPSFFVFLQSAVRPMMATRFPQEGWETEWLEVSSERVAFNIHRCFYLDTLMRYEAGELTAVFCATDDMVYDRVSRYLDWRRAKTLGRGDDCCDFRFVRLRPRSGGEVT